MKEETYLAIVERIKKANSESESVPATPAQDPKQDVGKPAGASGNENKTVAPPDTNITTAPAGAASVEKLAKSVDTALSRIKAVLKQADCDTAKNPPVPAAKETKAEEQSESLAPKTAAADEKTVVAETTKAAVAASAAVVEPESKPATAKEATLEELAKTAGEEVEIVLTPEHHYKLAAAILESEEGMALAEQLLIKQAGRERAVELITAALEQEEYSKIAAAEDIKAQDEYLQGLAACEEILEGFSKTASAEELDQAAKMAQVHADALAALPHDYARQAYVKAAMDAALMADQGDMGGEGDPSLGADAPMGLEEILEVLGMLVESGQLDEAQAQQIAEQLLAEQEGGGMEGGMPEEAKMAAAMAKTLLEAAKPE